MRRALTIHPDSRCPAVSGIDVEVERNGPGALTISYRLTGDIAALRLPPPGESCRADGLWQHTCFEAFVGEPATEAYYEFNFAPSLEWAAYAFDAYRNGMRAVEGIAPRPIAARMSEECFELTAPLDLSHLTKLSADAVWRLALSAIIEDKDGEKSWWALAHPPGKPDFHHQDSFVLVLPPR